MDGLGRVQGNAHKHVVCQWKLPVLFSCSIKTLSATCLRSVAFSLFVTAEWMDQQPGGHHYGTSLQHSESLKHTRTTYCWYNLSSCLSLDACVVFLAFFLFRMSWQRIRSWSRLTDSTYLRTSLRKIWPCSTTAMTGTTTPPCGWSRGLELTINHWHFFFALYEKWL